MKKPWIWKILLAIGILTFALPFISFGYELLIGSSWTLVDWLVLYSFVYWPTYVVGLILIFLAVSKLIKKP